MESGGKNNEEVKRPDPAENEDVKRPDPAENEDVKRPDPAENEEVKRPDQTEREAAGEDESVEQPAAKAKTGLSIRAWARRIVSKTGIFVGVVVAFVLGYWFSGGSGGKSGSSGAHKGHGHEEGQMWTCSMHPEIRQPKPGKCPICGMDLIPVTSGAKDETGPRELKMTRRAQALAEIRTARVERRNLSAQIRMVGKVAYDERRVKYITAWVAGRIDRLYVNYTGKRVRRGQAMVYLYSPELIIAQTELLEAIKAARAMEGSGLKTIRSTTLATVDAAREKLRLWGLSRGQIKAIEKRGRPNRHLAIYSPLSGVVIHKNALQGMYVRPGTKLFTIADLSKVWVKLDAYESDLAWLKKGQEVEFTTEAYPGTTFKGKVAFIDPFLNNATRTIKVRLVVKNKDGRLKPDMFVRAAAASQLGAKAKKEKPPLVIPATAPLITGKRAVVYLAVRGKPGTFRGQVVTLGPRAGDHYVVLKGLQEGDVVVTHGNFKIDSAVQILAKPSMMNPKGGGPVPGHDHGGRGKAARAPDSRKGAPVKVPPAFVGSLGKVFMGYLAVGSGLSGDDLGKAKAGANDLLASIKGVKMKVLKGHSHHEWMKIESTIRGSAGKVAGAADIESARKAFDDLSRAIINATNRFGVPKDQPLYRFHCPMAFNNRGADWLQGRTGTLNPYYGSKMLTCGTQEEVISP